MRERQRTGTGTGGGSLDTQVPFSNATFKLPLNNTLVPLSGTGPATFSRSTDGTCFDNEGKLKTIRTNGARFSGARRVRNLIPSASTSNNFSLWTVAGGGSVVGTNIFKCGNSTSRQYINAVSTPDFTQGRYYTFSARVRYINHNIVSLTGGSEVFGAAQYCKFDIVAGTYAAVGVTGSIIDLGGGLWQISMTGLSTTSANTLAFVLELKDSISSGRNDQLTGDGLKSVMIEHAQVEDATGQSDKLPSEPVSVGVLSTPWHGAGMDGLKYFTTDKAGTSLPTSMLRGYLTEGARTNNLLWNREMTNASWAKSNMSTALTATGIDGQPNAATVLTATGANATCLQARTLASAARSFSAYVKRRTGTGVVSITRDGGTTWKDITSEINTANYYRVSIENTSVTNPSCGFRISTSTDAIDVDYCQDEAGTFISSPIITTTVVVTRNQDALSYPMSGNISTSVGSITANFNNPEKVATSTVACGAVSSTTSGIFLSVNSAQPTDGISAYDSTNTRTASGFSRSNGDLRRGCVAWGSGLSLTTAGAGTPSTGSFDGTIGDGTTVYVGTYDGVTSPMFGNVRDLYMWSTELSSASMTQVVNS